jgi:nitroreductase
MNFIKFNSKSNFSKSKTFDFKPINDLKDYNLLTSFVKGYSPEFKSDNDKLFMVIEGNVKLKVNDKKTKVGTGDVVLVPGGEKFQFNAGTGAKLIQFKQPIPPPKPEHIKDLTSKRHSTRVFLDKPVAKQDIYYVLRIGIEAPSGVNRQPWKFIVVNDSEMKRKIRDNAENVEKQYYKSMENHDMEEDLKELGLTWQKPFLENAPFLICIFGDYTQPFYKESLWLATGWMLLAAAELNLSTLTYTPKEMDFLNELLGVSKKYRPELIMPIGYAAKEEKPQNRKDILEVVSWV